MSDWCTDKIEDWSRKCAGVYVCDQYHMEHTGWRGRPLLQCMHCEVSSLAIISTFSQLQLQVWRCRWNIHDRTHNGSWMKIQFHDAVIYNIFPVSKIHSIIFIIMERQVLIITDVIVYSERGVVVNYCGSYSFKQALITPSSQHI